MIPSTSPGSDDRVVRLIERLKAVREENAARNETDVTRALVEALRTELAGMSRNEADALLAGVRSALIEEARREDETIRHLQRDMASLSTQLESLRAERDALAREVKRLETGSTSRPTATPVAEAGGPFAGALRDVAANPEAGVEVPAGLAPSEVHALRMLRSLLLFAWKGELAAGTLKVGTGSRPDGTFYEKHYVSGTRARYMACVNGQEGSIEELDRVLDGVMSFFYSLPAAYQFAIPRGVEALLLGLEPNEIMKQHEGRFGRSYDKAWATYSRLHLDLTNAPPDDLWQMFFERPFREEIARAEAARRP